MDVITYCTGMRDHAFSYCTRNLHWFISKANTYWDNVTVLLSSSSPIISIPVQTITTALPPWNVVQTHKNTTFLNYTYEVPQHRPYSSRDSGWARLSSSLQSVKIFGLNGAGAGAGWAGRGNFVIIEQTSFQALLSLKTPATIDPNEFYTCFYLRNDHADTCYCRN